MIDPHLLAESPDVVRASLRRRGADAAPFEAVDRFVALHALRRAYIQEGDALRARRNTLSREIGAQLKAGQTDAAEALKAEVHAGAERVAAIDLDLAAVQAEQDAIAQHLPNLVHDSVPEGASEADNVIIRRWGTPRLFHFTPKSHVEIGTALGILDLERAAKLTGARFAVLSGIGARLERALIQFFLDLHTTEHGYTEVQVPYLVHRSVAEGTGQLPKFEKDMFRLAEPLNGQDAFLIPTAEVPVTNLHRDEILEHDALPIQYACFTPCFRSEAGSAGRDVRGLIRQHQFHKVELVWLTTPERADDDYDALVRHAEVCLQRLELPYRVSRLCGGDLGFGAARCHDLEVWLPSQDAFREISSCSHFTDFQSRRMQLRYRPPEVDGKKSKPRLAHTLNGSGLAVGRTLVAILENNQQEDGSVIVPAALRPYLGGLDRISRGA